MERSMKQTIETRELFVLDAGDGIVNGTYHKSYGENPSPKATSLERKRVGVLFLNSLTPARSATGDSAVYWADSVARCGYPALRIDLAGLGDAPGNPPTDLLGFINTGGYASLVSSNVKQLTQRFRLSSVVVVGLCAGAVSALYTAAACKECKGIILMDPYFHLPLANASSLSKRLMRRLSRGAPGRWIASTYDRVREFRAQFTGVPLPTNANLPLLNCWKSVASAGMPILILVAQHTKLKIGDFDYMSHILRLAGSNSEVVVEVIADTGHSFANRVGRSAVRQHTENWMNKYFPPKTRREASGNAMRSEVNNNATSNHRVGTCSQT
jgi:pimeloyl-ACP methyl ester carboxylesterase